MTVLSVDPGGKRVGAAFWTDDGLFREKHIWDFDSVLSELVKITEPITVIVCEGFTNRGMEKRGSKHQTSQVIGMLKLLAHQWGAEFIEQEPGILRVSAAHTGTQIPAKGHIRDDVSAYLHGHYYFVAKGILSARVIW